MNSSSNHGLSSRILVNQRQSSQSGRLKIWLFSLDSNTVSPRWTSILWRPDLIRDERHRLKPDVIFEWFLGISVAVHQFGSSFLAKVNFPAKWGPTEGQEPFFRGQDAVVVQWVSKDRESSDTSMLKISWKNLVPFKSYGASDFFENCWNARKSCKMPTHLSGCWYLDETLCRCSAWPIVPAVVSRSIFPWTGGSVFEKSEKCLGAPAAL